MSGTVFSGCGRDEGQASASDGDSVDIQFTWWGSTERHDRTQAAIAVFQEAHPGITVGTQFSGWDGYWDRLATQTAGGGAPDVIQMDYSYISEYARRNSLLPLDDYVPDPIDLTSFAPETLSGGELNGTLYGINFGVNSMALIYNASMLADVGAEMPDHTMTWDDFAQLVTELGAQAPEGVYGAEDGGQDAAALECWLLQRGKRLFDDDGQLGYGEDDLAEWFTFWQELRGSGGAAAPDVQASARGDVQDSLMARGLVVMDFAHSNQLAAYMGVTSGEVGVHMYPQGGAGSQPGQYLKPSQLLCVSASSSAPEAAAILINSLVNDPDVAGELGSERGIPASDTMREALRGEASPEEQAVYAYIDFLADKVGELPPAHPLGAGEVNNTILTNTNEKIAFGQLTPAEGAAQFVQDAERVLA
jgi:multiple sugar transport system substrate-binding protein